MNLNSYTTIKQASDNYFTTHNGTKHADEVTAFALYAALHGGLDKVKLVRTRDPKKFKGVVVDVGEGELDHHGKRYELDEDGIPYSGSSRLFNKIKGELKYSPEALKYFKKKVLDPVSKLDNGVKLRRGETNLFSFVDSFNKNYNEERMPTNDDRLFMDASDIAYKILNRELENLKYRDIVIEKLKRYKKNKNDIVYVEKGIPWETVLPATPAKFAIIDNGNAYSLKCVPDPVKGKFSKKIALPKEWYGTRDKEFQDKSGYPSGTFCHRNGFVAGFKSSTEANDAARKILKDYYKNTEEDEIK